MTYSKRRQVEDIPADIAALVRIGTVLSVDLGAARCIVLYGDPDDAAPAETPPIRWLTPRAGATRIWSPPSTGEQVLLLSPDGQIGSAIALPGLWQNDFPPLGSTAMEMIEFADGAQITYDADAGQLRAILPAGATAEIEAPGGITLRGDVTILGNVDISGDVAIDGAATVTETVTADDDVLGGGVSLKNHVHSGVQSGQAKTLKPD
ncbi:phage baseplate assembly protein V [Erythrobacter sp. EC-HK427]|uniref:phage baseplate assembly protein V n=1 Tax=Erythrobacter sp. EC-HK427 TaxID=2038396 RepID=UPI0012512C92|nr:phage baseplate assembly protein V [Erythrobacter sp. EC-HK427]VVT07335.1 Phage baseplate assembly protein V [Erythrobacter sp. EC-HK427]